MWRNSAKMPQFLYGDQFMQLDTICSGNSFFDSKKHLVLPTWQWKRTERLWFRQICLWLFLRTAMVVLVCIVEFVCYFVAPRSGLALKKFIDVGAGVVDCDYRGPLGIVLFNFGDEDFEGIDKLCVCDCSEEGRSCSSTGVGKNLHGSHCGSWESGWNKQG